MPLPSQSLPTVGQPASTEDPKTRAAILELQQIVAALDGSNFPTSFISTFIRTLLDDADAATARATLGLFDRNTQVTTSQSLTISSGKPAAIFNLAGYYIEAASADIAIATLTTRGGPVQLALHGGDWRNDHTGIGQVAAYEFRVDGSVIKSENMGSIGSGTQVKNTPMTRVVNVAAGVHTFSFRNPTSDGSSSIAMRGDSSNGAIQFSAVEL